MYPNGDRCLTKEKYLNKGQGGQDNVLRHNACSNVYRIGRDIRLTQWFARHASILTTAIHTHPTDEELIGAVQGLVC